MWLLLGCAGLFEPPPMQELRADFERSQEQSFVDCGTAVLSACPGEAPPDAVQCFIEERAAGEAVTLLLESEDRSSAVYWLARGGVEFPLIELARTSQNAWRSDCTNVREWENIPRSDCFGLAYAQPCEGVDL